MFPSGKIGVPAGADLESFLTVARMGVVGIIIRDKELKIHIEKIHFESFVQRKNSLCQRPEHYFFARAKLQVSLQFSAFIDISRPPIHGGELMNIEI